MKTLLALTLFVATCLECSATDIRVRNDSSIDYRDVVVGGKKYGDIKPGAATEYQHWVAAYGYSSVSLLSNGKPFNIQPIDYVGEKLLGDGKFTYVLTLKDGQLDIRAEKDAK